MATLYKKNAIPVIQNKYKLFIQNKYNSCNRYQNNSGRIVDFFSSNNCSLAVLKLKPQMLCQIFKFNLRILKLILGKSVNKIKSKTH